MGQVVEVAKRFCPSNQPRVQVVQGDVRIAFMASQDRVDPVEELKMMSRSLLMKFAKS